MKISLILFFGSLSLLTSCASTRSLMSYGLARGDPVPHLKIVRPRYSHSEIFANPAEATYDYWLKKGVAEAEAEISGKNPRGITIYAVGENLDGQFDEDTGLPLYPRYSEFPTDREKWLMLAHNARIMKEIRLRGLPPTSSKWLTKEEALKKFEEGQRLRLNFSKPAGLEAGRYFHVLFLGSDNEKTNLLYNRRSSINDPAVDYIFKVPGPENGMGRPQVVWLTNPSLAIIVYFETVYDPKKYPGARMLTHPSFRKHILVLDPMHPGRHEPEARVLRHWVDKLPEGMPPLPPQKSEENKPTP